MDQTLYPENEGAAAEGRRPHFLHIYYGPSVACTVGCTLLMYSLCMAHIWPMYDLYMAYITVFLYMPSLVYLLVGRFLSMLRWVRSGLVFIKKIELTPREVRA